jgi:xanthine dehydrogenase accessory factor
VIDVFVEPASGAAASARAIRLALEDRRPLAAVTMVEPADGAVTGARILIHPTGEREGSLGDPTLDEEAAEAAARAIEDERSRLVPLARGGRAFVEALVPAPRLLVCGAGHDARPLVRLAAGLGWRVEVVDDREAFLKARRFPEAGAFVKTEPIDAASATAVDARSYVVVMSHNFLRDKDYLRSFLGSPTPYLGMLGPAARLDRLLDQLRREGYEARPEDLGVVHGPAGLDLGGDGPEEVAWSILAEAIAVRNGRTGGSLRDRSGPIHDSPGAHEHEAIP